MPISITSLSADHAYKYHIDEVNARKERDESKQFDYYINQESGVWYGKGAELLGFSNKVIDKKDFYDVVHGKFSYINSDGKMVKVDLTKHAKNKEHRAGIEIGFDVPKSLSILAEIYGKTEITDALIQATNNTLDYIQDNLMYVRTQENKEIKFEKVDNMLVGKFLHNDSREKDPLIHFHALLMNIAVDKQGNVKTAIFNEILSNKKFIGEIFDNEWQHVLQELGYTFRDVKKVTQIAKEVLGIADQQIKYWSKRRNEIENIADREGVDKRDRGKMQKITNKTRKAKDTSKTLKELREEWIEKEKELVGIERFNEISNDSLKSKKPINKEKIVPLDKIVESSIAHLTERKTTFTRLELISTILRRNKGNYNLKDIEKIIDENKEIIHNMVEIDKYSKGINTFNTVVSDVYTTKASLETENAIITKVTDGKNKFKSIYTKGEIDNFNGLITKDNNSNSNPKNIDYNERLKNVEQKYIDNLHKNIDKLLEQEPVVKVTGNDFVGLNKKETTEQVYNYFKEKDKLNLYNSEIGNVKITKNGIKDSYSHKRIYQEKAIAFKCIDSIIENGTVIKKETDFKGRGYTSYLLAAPIIINNKDYIAEVVVNEYQNQDKTFYFHDVKEKELYKQVLNAKAPVNSERALDDSSIVNFFYKVKQKNLQKNSQIYYNLTTTFSPVLPPTSLYSTLNDNQKHTVEFILKSKDQFIGIQGYAGVGKTYTIKALNEKLNEKGYSIIGLAPTNSATATLAEEAGIKTRTLQSFLTRYDGYANNRGNENTLEIIKKQFKNKIILVDEASLISNNQMRNLLTIADKFNVRVILQGDEKQLDSVEAGTPFSKLIKSKIINYSELSNILRQKDEIIKQAVYDSINKNIIGTFSKLEKNNNIIELRTNEQLEKEEKDIKEYRYNDKNKVDNINNTDNIGIITDNVNSMSDLNSDRDNLKNELVDKVVETYLKYDKEARKETLIVTSSNEIRKAINEKIRESIKKENRENGVYGINSGNEIVGIKDIKKSDQIHKVESKYIDNLDKNIKVLMEMKSVASIGKNEFKDSGKKLTDKITEFYNDIGGYVERENFGTVRLSKGSVKDSIMHGHRNEDRSIKINAFKAVPEVIKNGVIINKELNWKDRGYNTYLIAAPISIEKREYIAEVIVKETHNDKKFYLHQVNEKDAIETEVSSGRRDIPISERKPPINSILANFIQNVKQNILETEKQQSQNQTTTIETLEMKQLTKQEKKEKDNYNIGDKVIFTKDILIYGDNNNLEIEKNAEYEVV
ncbi:MAG: relaxase domain-containing protein, partial [Endomicrobium sp.]|nr:relaxase domain-containing protein [Endomicrobium sp.]